MGGLPVYAVLKIGDAGVATSAAAQGNQREGIGAGNLITTACAQDEGVEVAATGTSAQHHDEY